MTCACAAAARRPDACAPRARKTCSPSSAHAGAAARCRRQRPRPSRPQAGSITVRSTRSAYRTNAVLLAIGRRGTPRKLEVPGEELPKVVYRLIEPEQYAGRKVLVVGGGDSALEAAATLAEEGAGPVVLSYRGEAFGRAKPRNRDRVAQAQASGRLRVLLSSRVLRIAERKVELSVGDSRIVIPNDAVIVNAGGVLPTELLQRIGIRVETRWGTA
ncbi:MAG: NAD(P)-binding domain-containing protein [Steroidobacteraceae bacterium]